jgi:hypothetical protein
MKNTIKLLFLGLFLFGITATRAQISTSTGGAANVLANVPTSNTNVGIGTTTPTEKLVVRGNGARIKIETSSDPTNYYAYLESKWDSNNSFNVVVQGTHMFGSKNIGMGTPDAYISNYYGIAFATQTSTVENANVRMYLTQAGNLGVGTTSPAGKLDVNGGVFLKGKSILDSDGTSSYFQSNAASYFQNNGSVSAMITSGGYFGIGTTNPDEKLTVKGKIHAEEIKVDLAVPADYVFQKYYTGKSELKSDYCLPTLAEIETFTKQNHHLPNIPSAKDIQQNGVSLGEMSNVLLQKIEELTLYAIEQDKKAALQQQELERLKTENENYKSLATRLSAIEKELKR